MNEREADGVMPKNIHRDGCRNTTYLVFEKPDGHAELVCSACRYGSAPIQFLKRRCADCRKPLWDTSPKQNYCDDACKQHAYRRRKTAAST